MKKETRPVKYRKTIILPKAKLFNQINWLLKEKHHNKPNQKFKEDVRRLEEGEPLDYVIGFTEFLGCKIDLSKKPLIPRPETEYWVEQTIEEIKNNYSLLTTNYQLKILDMFSGSGCVGVSIMRHIPKSHVVFTEKDVTAVEQIKINCRLNKINKKRYKVIQSDIFNDLLQSSQEHWSKFDYILANPPYIPIARKNKIQKSVLHYEPSVALFGGKDGMLYIKKFLSQAKNFLNSNGKIYMEFDSIQKRDIEKLTKGLGYGRAEFFKDQYGKWRWVVIILNN